MKTINLLISCVCLALLMTVTPQAKEWRGIVPLHSTRTDVERLLGKPNAKYDRYDFDNERVDITYSRHSCAEGAQWNVPRDTVTQIRISPKQKLRLADLQLDLSKYKKVNDPHVQVHTIYWNEEEGIQYVVFVGGGEDDGMILEIYYEPATTDASLRCPVAAARRPCKQ